ncbi:hypothetical protein EMGR_004836 [Emarellia grisea]
MLQATNSSTLFISLPLFSPTSKATNTRLTQLYAATPVVNSTISLSFSPTLRKSSNVSSSTRTRSVISSVYRTTALCTSLSTLRPSASLPASVVVASTSRTARSSSAVTPSFSASGACAFHSYTAPLRTATRQTESSRSAPGRIVRVRMAPRKLFQPSATGGECSRERSRGMSGRGCLRAAMRA